MTTTTAPELKPCPHCGSEPKLCDTDWTPIGDAWFVSCACRPIYSATPAAAIAAWNRRADTAAHDRGFREGVEKAAEHIDKWVVWAWDADTWRTKTKKELTVMACHECAAAIRTLVPDAGEAADPWCSIVDEIAAERRRQIEVEGWQPERDDHYVHGEMAMAAACYAATTALDDATRACGGRAGGPWPWDAKWWKPKDRRRDLVRAAALIVAEIERLDRASPPRAKGGER